MVIEDILSLIAKYYPVGLKHYGRNEYPGYKTWAGIVEKKINDLIAYPPGPCEHLVADLKASYPFKEVHDRSYYQYPSYTIHCLIDVMENDHVKHTRSLCIDISLLGQYYSYFIEDELTYKSKDEHLGRDYLPSSYILSRHYVTDEKLVGILQKVEPLMDKHFKEWQFINHTILFTISVEAIPYHELSFERSASAYDLLLSNRYMQWPFVKVSG